MLTKIGLLEPILAQFHAEFSLWLLSAMSDFSSPTRGGCEAGANERARCRVPFIQAAVGKCNYNEHWLACMERRAPPSSRLPERGQSRRSNRGRRCGPDDLVLQTPSLRRSESPRSVAKTSSSTWLGPFLLLDTLSSLVVRTSGTGVGLLLACVVSALPACCRRNGEFMPHGPQLWLGERSAGCSQ